MFALNSLFQHLASADRPLDAYQLAKASGAAPMEVGRALHVLHTQGRVTPVDELGTANDLACRWRVSDGA